MKRVCILTGASGKLGTAFCKQHANKYQIAAIYHRRLPSAVTQFQHLVDPLGKAPLKENEHPVFAIKADLRCDTELERIVELTLARFDRIDLVIHAAVQTVTGPILRNNALLDSAERQLHMNILVPLRLASIIAREFWQHEEAANREANRNWINVSSTSATNVYRGSGQSVYSASKAAMNMLTQHMADEFLSIGIRVNALAPNSFPRIVSTAGVVEGLRQLDTGTMTGTILVVDANQSRQP
jgi:NAD(P)-dependent dehydrogenase (short-subunit alcohol dehydrogenase family)